MQQLTYIDIVKRHGRVKAFDLLRSVETLANIQDEINLANEEARFQHALNTLNKINFSMCN